MAFLLMAKAIKSEIPDCYAKWLMVVLADHANEDTHGAASGDYSGAASDSEDSLFSFSSDDYGSGDDTSSSAPS